MSKVVAIVKRTCQVSPDDWERITYSKSFYSEQSIDNIIRWVQSMDADINTLMVRLDENETKDI